MSFQYSCYEKLNEAGETGEIKLLPHPHGSRLQINSYFNIIHCVPRLGERSRLS